MGTSSRTRACGCGGGEEEMRKEKILRLAKGFRGRAKNCFRVAINRVEKALQYQYRDRARKLWIQQINAATRQHGIIYSKFIHTLSEDNIKLDRKILSELAMNEPYSFKALVDRVKFMRGIE